MYMTAYLPLFFTLLGTPASLMDEYPAVTRGLAFMEHEVSAWNKERTCVSCHNALPILLSFRNADARGFKINADAYADWRAKALDIKRAIPAESLAYLVLALSGTPLDETGRQTFQELVERLEGMGGADQNWKAGGQRLLEKRRAPRSTREVSLWSRLALLAAQDSPREGEASPTRPAAEQATSAAEQATSAAETVESMALELSLARIRGKTDRTALLSARLWEAQNEDGGWGPRPGETSEPIATGQSLFALGAQSGPGDRAGRAKAQAFLHKTQGADGSWTSVMNNGWNEEMTEKSVYWATAWAVMGLLGAMEPPL